MALNDRRVELNDAPPANYALRQLSHLQTDLVAGARIWAMGEVGAAVAHQLNDPLTALLIYLHEIEQSHVTPANSAAPTAATLDMVERAAHEVDRVCDILERMRQGGETSLDSQPAVERGRDAIDAWVQNSRRPSGDHRQASIQSYRDPRRLTPREEQVVAQITAGASNKEGSHRLGISTRTFEVHRAHIMRKLGARNTADLVRTVLTEIK
jgi:DNA-binding CsgD family transcriptional regulator